MSKCPRCSEEIDHLLVDIVEITHDRKFDSINQYEDIDMADEVYEKYKCPKCKDVVAYTEDNASDILTAE